jgi:predicted ArsR family transcriptional regulator
MSNDSTTIRVGDVALDLAKEHPHRDPEVLETLYFDEDLSSRQMGELLGCTKTTVLKWMDRHEIDKRPYEDEALLRELYHQQNMSSSEIAERFNLTAAGVRKVMRRLGIEVRDGSDASTVAGLQRPPTFKTNLEGYEYFRSKVNGESQFVYHHRLLAAAEFGVAAVDGMEVHHENGVPWDNRPGNIELVTAEEHARLHHKKSEGEA